MFLLSIPVTFQGVRRYTVIRPGRPVSPAVLLLNAHLELQKRSQMASISLGSVTCGMHVHVSAPWGCSKQQVPSIDVKIVCP